jgi:cell wall-associated NlpC family hydrolase
VPEHALRTPRFDRVTKNHRSKVLIAGCAVAGVATLGACSPGDVSSGARAVNIASQYIGTPYVYGGAAPGGFDCSGLTQYVYAQLGRGLPRSAEAQYEAAQKIPQSWAQKGDLIFFGSPGSVYHVGIYEGNGVIEHAARPGTNVEYIRIWTGDYMVGRV